MNHEETNDLSHSSEIPSSEIQSSELHLDRLDELLSCFFDDCLTEEQMAELNEMLLTDPTARERSFETAQLHADLYSYFNDRKQPAIAPALPLPIPGMGAPSFG